jgi:hypothetical protein
MRRGFKSTGAAAKAAEKQQQGGRGSASREAECDSPPHTPQPSAAASSPATTAPPTTRASAAYSSLQQAQMPRPSASTLPYGAQPVGDPRKLARLCELYAEIKHCQQVYHYTQQYLPKLPMLTTLASHIKQLEAEIATLAKAGSCAPSSQKSPARG